jgi:hypothetical protein
VIINAGVSLASELPYISVCYSDVHYVSSSLTWRGGSQTRVPVQCGTLQNSAVQYSTVRFSTVEYSAVLFRTEQYSTVQYNAELFRTVQCSAVQYDIDFLD